MKRVLVLDDSKERIKTFKKLLIGFSVTYCSTAEEAIKQLHSNEFDLIFLDHDLGPEDEGKQVPEINSGTTVANSMNPLEILNDPFIVIHSLNGEPARWMEKSLRKRGFRVMYVPYTNIHDIDFERLAT